MPDSLRAAVSYIRETIKWRKRIYFEYVLGVERYPYKKYCDKYKCIFIHIPKNAGTSIITLLNNNNPIEQEHCRYWDYLRSDIVRLRSYEVFCVVRNPWDRLLSAYHYLKEGGSKGRDKNLTDMMNSQCDNFQDFVLNWLDYDKIYNITVLNPQFIYIYDFQDKKLAVNNILHFESLSEDFFAFQKKIGVTKSLPWINKSKNSDYKEHYTKEMVDVVSVFYAFDIKLFKYYF